MVLECYLVKFVSLKVGLVWYWDGLSGKWVVWDGKCVVWGGLG